LKASNVSIGIPPDLRIINCSINQTDISRPTSTAVTSKLSIFLTSQSGHSSHIYSLTTKNQSNLTTACHDLHMSILTCRSSHVDLHMSISLHSFMSILGPNFILLLSSYPGDGVGKRGLFLRIFTPRNAVISPGGCEGGATTPLLSKLKLEFGMAEQCCDFKTFEMVKQQRQARTIDRQIRNEPQYRSSLTGSSEL